MGGWAACGALFWFGLFVGGAFCVVGLVVWGLMRNWDAAFAASQFLFKVQ
ncbi:hypothetical protein HMPREF3198_00045 [Winkia neuii]|nr:hypothetical protein HMPREF3198_00045 [Winkia neuii]